MSKLREGNNAAWEQLWSHFRERVMPYIRKKLGTLPINASVSQDYVAEEIFSESLFKFYELFKTGTFENEGQLRGLMFRITDLKIKEIRRKVIKESRFFYPETPIEKGADTFEISEKEQKEFEIIRLLGAALKKLPEIEREILLRFASGEKLKKIGEDLNLNEAGCRKKKQRSLEKLRKLLPPFSEIGVVFVAMQMIQLF